MPTPANDARVELDVMLLAGGGDALNNENLRRSKETRPVPFVEVAGGSGDVCVSD